MKLRWLVLASVLLTALAMGGQTREPGAVWETKTWDPLHNPPPGTTKPQPVRLAHLQQDAQELARLAQLIPPEIQQVEKGVLPKDLDGQLKQIEKLSKQLRREISP